MEIIDELLATVRENTELITQYAKFLGILFFGILFLSSLFRFLFGKKAQLNRAVSSAVEIFGLYVVNTVLFTMGIQWELFLSPLPFVSLEDNILTVFAIQNSQLHDVSSQLLKLLMIAFLVNILDDFVPQGQHVITWYFFRLVSVALAVGANYVIDLLLGQILPPEVMQVAPTILLGCLVALVLLGSLKLLVGAALVFLDPIVAALYTFFFASYLGRHLARAMVSTTLLTLLVVALNALELTVFYISVTALIACIPLLIIVLVLWYIVGHIL